MRDEMVSVDHLTFLYVFQTISHFYVYYVSRNPRQCAVFLNLSKYQFGASRLVVIFDVSHVVILDPLDILITRVIPF